MEQEPPPRPSLLQRLSGNSNSISITSADSFMEQNPPTRVEEGSASHIRPNIFTKGSDDSGGESVQQEEERMILSRSDTVPYERMKTAILQETEQQQQQQYVSMRSGSSGPSHTAPHSIHSKYHQQYQDEDYYAKYDTSDLVGQPQSSDPTRKRLEMEPLAETRAHVDMSHPTRSGMEKNSYTTTTSTRKYETLKTSTLGTSGSPSGKPSVRSSSGQAIAAAAVGGATQLPASRDRSGSGLGLNRTPQKTRTVSPAQLESDVSREDAEMGGEMGQVSNASENSSFHSHAERSRIGNAFRSRKLKIQQATAPPPPPQARSSSAAAAAVSNSSLIPHSLNRSLLTGKSERYLNSFRNRSTADSTFITDVPFATSGAAAAGMEEDDSVESVQAYELRRLQQHVSVLSDEVLQAELRLSQKDDQLEESKRENVRVSRAAMTASDQADEYKEQLFLTRNVAEEQKREAVRANLKVCELRAELLEVRRQLQDQIQQLAAQSAALRDFEEKTSAAKREVDVAHAQYRALEQEYLMYRDRSAAFEKTLNESTSRDKARMENTNAFYMTIEQDVHRIADVIENVSTIALECAVRPFDASEVCKRRVARSARSKARRNNSTQSSPVRPERSSERRRREDDAADGRYSPASNNNNNAVGSDDEDEELDEVLQLRRQQEIDRDTRLYDAELALLSFNSSNGGLKRNSTTSWHGIGSVSTSHEPNDWSPNNDSHSNLSTLASRTDTQQQQQQQQQSTRLESSVKISTRRLLSPLYHAMKQLRQVFSATREERQRLRDEVTLLATQLTGLQQEVEILTDEAEELRNRNLRSEAIRWQTSSSLQETQRHQAQQTQHAEQARVNLSSLLNCEHATWYDVERNVTRTVNDLKNAQREKQDLQRHLDELRESHKEETEEILLSQRESSEGYERRLQLVTCELERLRNAEVKWQLEKATFEREQGGGGMSVTEAQSQLRVAQNDLDALRLRVRNELEPQLASQRELLEHYDRDMRDLQSENEMLRHTLLIHVADVERGANTKEEEVTEGRGARSRSRSTNSTRRAGDARAAREASVLENASVEDVQTNPPVPHSEVKPHQFSHMVYTPTPFAATGAHDSTATPRSTTGTNPGAATDADQSASFTIRTALPATSRYSDESRARLGAFESLVFVLRAYSGLRADHANALAERRALWRYLHAHERYLGRQVVFQTASTATTLILRFRAAVIAVLAMNRLRRFTSQSWLREVVQQIPRVGGEEGRVESPATATPRLGLQRQRLRLPIDTRCFVENGLIVPLPHEEGKLSHRSPTTTHEPLWQPHYIVPDDVAFPAVRSLAAILPTLVDAVTVPQAKEFMYGYALRVEPPLSTKLHRGLAQVLIKATLEDSGRTALSVATTVSPAPAGPPNILVDRKGKMVRRSEDDEEDEEEDFKESYGSMRPRAAGTSLAAAARTKTMTTTTNSSETAYAVASALARRKQRAESEAAINAMAYPSPYTSLFYEESNKSNSHQLLSSSSSSPSTSQARTQFVKVPAIVSSKDPREETTQIPIRVVVARQTQREKAHEESASENEEDEEKEEREVERITRDWRGYSSQSNDSRVRSVGLENSHHVGGHHHNHQHLHYSTNNSSSTSRNTRSHPSYAYGYENGREEELMAGRTRTKSPHATHFTSNNNNNNTTTTQSNASDVNQTQNSDNSSSSYMFAAEVLNVIEALDRRVTGALNRFPANDF